MCVLLGRFLTSDPSILQTKIIEKPLDTQNQSVLVTACLHKCAYMRTQEAAETACTLVRVRVRPRSGSERSSSLTCLEGGKALSLAGPDGGAMHYEFDKVYGVCVNRLSLSAFADPSAGVQQPRRASAHTSIQIFPVPSVVWLGARKSCVSGSLSACMPQARAQTRKLCFETSPSWWTQRWQAATALCSLMDRQDPARPTPCL